MPVVEFDRVSKYYSGPSPALSGVDLSIDQGSAFGIIGENGAGKTTLIRLLLGFIFPSSGSVQVFGHQRVERAHPRVGYVMERQFSDLFLTGRQYLAYAGQLSNLWGRGLSERIDTLLATTGLTGSADRALRSYSKGMLQRLNIAQALLTKPDLLVLDEPTSALDPAEQRTIRDVVAELRRSGTTVLLCSHNLTEVEELCDTVGILKSGRLIRVGRLAEMVEEMDQVAIEFETSEDVATAAALIGPGDSAHEVAGRILTIPRRDQSRIVKSLIEAGIAFRSVNPVVESLESLYLRETHD